MQQRVAVWGMGNMGRTAIRSAVAFPGLRLSGVITSSPEKTGADAATFAGLDTSTGVAATTDIDAALAGSDAVAYMASGDTRPDEAVNDIERCLRAGVHVVTRRSIRFTTRDPHRRSGSPGSPLPRSPAAPRCWSAASTRGGPTTRWR